MDDDYYYYTIEHSTLEEGVHIANIESLICLKCRTYLEMTERKSNGEQVDSKHIVKHKKDVFRLVAMLAPADTYEVPDSLKQDVDRFCLAVKEEVPNSDFFKSAGLKSISGEQLLEQLEANFITQQ